MEVRSGGGDRYGASRYPVPSTGAVHGGSSTKLLGLLCGYWLCLFVFVFAGLCFWPGQAFSLSLCLLLSLKSFSLPVRLARLNCRCLPLSCVVVVSRRLVVSSLVSIEWYFHFIGVGNPPRLLVTSRCVCVCVCVFVWSRRPWPWFHFRSLGFTCSQ